MSTDSNDSTAIDTHSRGPLLLLLGSGVLWLVISGVLALIASIQLHTPTFLADCAWLTFGRVQALRETAFVYGWLANAGLALGLWIAVRLGGEVMRAGNWVVVGTLFWNLGVSLSLVGIAAGDAAGHTFFQIPSYAQPLLLVAYGAIGVAGVLAWAGRRRETGFASQWYVFAALFLFPWLFSVAQVTLVWLPVRGVLQTIVAGWFTQGVYSLWLAPLALALEPAADAALQGAHAHPAAIMHRHAARLGGGGHGQQGQKKENTHQLNFPSRGKPCGGALPAPARLPRQGVVSVSVRVRPPGCGQERPSAARKTRASESPPSL
jgi:hypothetical protein